MSPTRFAAAVTDWYAGAARDLPWRRPGVSAWGVLVSEVMLQQTQVARVEPVWVSWMDRWPTPAALAAEPAGAAVRAWGRLGYPRRALRLHAAAVAIAAEHDGDVPAAVAALRALPGVGDYTAAAVAAFAFGARPAVLDTNVRRVYARVFDGVETPAASPSVAERSAASARVPAADPGRYSVAVMELGALVCTARAPRCSACPVADACRWKRAGHPAGVGRSRQPAYRGSDREARGRLLALLRAHDAVDFAALAGQWHEPVQSRRALAGLVADGLVEPLPDGRYRLPA
jgi:A/G-specific adenine glycosylase